MEITRLEVLELLEQFANAERYGVITLQIEKGKIVFMEETIKYKPKIK